MKEKAFVLQNKGMNRDLSVSKAGESSAYENHNIRILARDHDTALSVTNERGNKQIDLKWLEKELLRITEQNELRSTNSEEQRVAEGRKDGLLANGNLPGELVGWNVLNNHIILFLHKSGTLSSNE